METVAQTFQRQLIKLWESITERLPYVVVALIVFILFVLIAQVGRKAFRKLAERAGLHTNLIELFGRLIAFIIVILGFFVAAVVIFPGFQAGDLIAGLGITTVAIGFAFKDILQNFFAGILILWRRPFEVGDVINVAGFEGTVEQINSRSTRIRTYDGERAIVPNGDIYTSSILVKTAYHTLRLKVSVGIGYADSIEKAREVILEALDRIDLVLKEPSPSVLVDQLAESTVNLKIYFWIEPRTSALVARSQVAEAIKRSLDDAGIEMPFPHLIVQQPRQDRGSALHP